MDEIARQVIFCRSVHTDYQVFNCFFPAQGYSLFYSLLSMLSSQETLTGKVYVLAVNTLPFQLLLQPSMVISLSHPYQ